MKVTIHKKESEHALDCSSDESILQAALRQGFALDYECATGTCGTCRAKLVNGELDQGWPEAPGREKIKTERGEFLMCQARPLGDCDIRIPGKVVQSSADTFDPTHLQGTIRAIQPLTHDVLQFRVQLTEPMRFRAGQFVTLLPDTVAGARAYSMVNYDHNSQSLLFVIKRFPGGKFSDWVFDHSPEAAAVNVFGPLGNAVFEPEMKKDILCIAGGSGIAGIMSILAHACRDDYFSSHRGDIYFGVRSVDDIFYLDELTAFAAQYPQQLKITIALSEPGDVEVQQNLLSHVSMTTGFVHLAARQSDLKPDNTIAYIAGPPPMVDGALRDLIAESGYAPDNIRYDKFG